MVSAQIADRDRCKKEKELEEAVATTQLAEEKSNAAAWSEEKKCRNEGKKREEEKKKKASDLKNNNEDKVEKERMPMSFETIKGRAEDEDNSEPITTKKDGRVEGTDVADPSINEHLDAINKGGGDDVTNKDMEDDRLTDSPQKKKRKREKKKKKKEEKKEKEESKKSIEDEPAVVTPLSMRKGRFTTGSNSKMKTQKKERALMEMYIHRHTRWMIELAMKCVENNKHAEFIHGVRKLLGEVQTKCPMAVVEPVTKGKGKRYIYPSNVSYNFTKLDKNVKVERGHRALKTMNPWGKEADKITEEDYKDPVVIFSLCFSTDKDPEDIIAAVGAEWHKVGGTKMYRKQLASFKEVTPIVILCLLNSSNRLTIIEEFTNILKEAQERRNLDEMEEMDGFRDMEIPKFSLTVKVPKLQGEDTQIYKGWKGQEQWNWKCIHIGMEKAKYRFVRVLVNKAKKRDLFRPIWGRHVIVSKLKVNGSDQDDGTGKKDLRKLISDSRHYINYHATMIYNGLSGVMDLDWKVAIPLDEDPMVLVGEVSLQDILYEHIKMDNGTPMIAEVHQRTLISPVDIVVPNTSFAEGQVAQMNKNLAAYLLNYLQDIGIEENFVKELIRVAIHPELRNKIKECEWEKKERELVTPEDKENAVTQMMQKSPWYKDMFKGLKIGDKKNERKYADKEMLYNLNDNNSVNTISAKPTKNIAGHLAR